MKNSIGWHPDRVEVALIHEAVHGLQNADGVVNWKLLSYERQAFDVAASYAQARGYPVDNPSNAQLGELYKGHGYNNDLD